MREPCAVVDADDGERYVAVHVLGRADLLLAATGALVQRHLDLQLERRQIFVLELVREHLSALGLGSKLLAALAAQVLLENHPFFFPGRDLRFTRADLLDQPQHEVAVNRQLVILRAGEHRHLERGKLERPVLPGNRRQRLQLAGAGTSRATRDLQCHGLLQSGALFKLFEYCRILSVETACLISSPFAIERSSSRMTFPERVFGRLSPKRMSFGFALAPISLPTQ